MLVGDGVVADPRGERLTPFHLDAVEHELPEAELVAVATRTVQRRCGAERAAPDDRPHRPGRVDVARRLFRRSGQRGNVLNGRFDAGQQLERKPALVAARGTRPLDPERVPAGPAALLAPLVAR